MIRITSNILFLIFYFFFITTCNKNKREVLVAYLNFDGTCCSGKLILYSNNTFKISYSLADDGFESSCEGNFSIDDGIILLVSNEIKIKGNGILISEVGDLFDDSYKFEFKSLIPIHGGNRLDINSIENSFFSLPSGFLQENTDAENNTINFNLSDSILALDSIDLNLPNFDPLPHYDNCKLFFDLPENSKIVDAERQVYIYPTIWSSSSDNLAQFIQIDDLVCISQRKLDIKQPNICIYPKIEITKSILKSFENLSKDALKNNLLNLMSKSNEWVNEPKEKDKEKRKWLSYLDNYTTGDFYTLTNKTFCVDYFEIFLIIKFELDRKIETKVFHTRHYYGN
jgi:hypothetical protein